MVEGKKADSIDSMARFGIGRLLTCRRLFLVDVRFRRGSMVADWAVPNGCPVKSWGRHEAALVVFASNHRPMPIIGSFTLLVGILLMTIGGIGELASQATGFRVAFWIGVAVAILGLLGIMTGLHERSREDR